MVGFSIAGFKVPHDGRDQGKCSMTDDI